jgi:Tfp pilus assembly protein PilF
VFHFPPSLWLSTRARLDGPVWAATCLLSLLAVAILPAKVGAEAAPSEAASAIAAGQIYYRAEAAWNDREERVAIAAESKRLAAQRTDAPNAYLAWSLVTLADGHKGGDRFQRANYLRGSVRAAVVVADLALKRYPDVSLAHSHRALLHLVSGELEAAQRELEVAETLAKPGFHSQLYAAVIDDEAGRRVRAHELLIQAERFATHPHHYTMVNRARVRVARRDGDRELEEQLHLENIEMNSGSAHAHGSYGDFLLRVRRTEEAALRYERATAIERYPAAVRGLDKARLRLRLAQPKAERPTIRRGLASEPSRQ